jgi:hypothetical protein
LGQLVACLAIIVPRCFTALVLADNQLMLNLLEELGEVEVSDPDAGAVQVTVELPERGLGRLRALLRAVARGELRPHLR